MLPSSFIHSPPASFVLLLFLSPPLPSRPVRERTPAESHKSPPRFARSLDLSSAGLLLGLDLLSLILLVFRLLGAPNLSRGRLFSDLQAGSKGIAFFLPSFLPWISFPPLRATSPRGNPRGDLSEANPFLWGPLRAPLSPPSLGKYYQMGEVYLDRSVKPEPAANGITQGNQVTNLMSAGWTDERHTHYISSMEASFINRLYNHGNNANKKDSGTNGFKVLQGGAGVWKKVEFERPNACAQVGANRSLPANPWIQHFRSRDCYSSSAGGDGAETLVGDHESGIRTIPGRTPLSHGRELGACKAENLLDENSEVSDQNFADDDEAEVGAESSKACKKRRLSSSSTYFVQMTQ